MSTPDDLAQFEVPPAPEPSVAKPVEQDAIDKETKIAFLAHILTGAPFIQRYDVATVGFLEFATVSSVELDRIRYLSALGVPRKAATDRLRALLAVACVNRLEIDGRMIVPVQDRQWSSSLAYDTFIKTAPVGLLQVIESYYADFSRTLATLIGKVSDRSFWPTP